MTPAAGGGRIPPGGAQRSVPPSPVWLDCGPDRLLCKAIDPPREPPKSIVNAGRLGRGPWRAAATLDREGLARSRRFFGLWPHEAVSDVGPVTFAAIPDGPAAGAFLAIRSPANGIRISAVERIPVPSALPSRAGGPTTGYPRLLAQPAAPRRHDGKLESLPTQIDGAVLGAYDLPPRPERRLLDYCRSADRPAAHPWRHRDASKQCGRGPRTRRAGACPVASIRTVPGFAKPFGRCRTTKPDSAAPAETEWPRADTLSTPVGSPRPFAPSSWRCAQGGRGVGSERGPARLRDTAGGAGLRCADGRGIRRSVFADPRQMLSTARAYAVPDAAHHASAACAESKTDPAERHLARASLRYRSRRLEEGADRATGRGDRTEAPGR